jgi:hypothetical protein
MILRRQAINMEECDDITGPITVMRTLQQS